MNENESEITRVFAPESSLHKKTLLVITPDFPDEKNQYIGSIFVKNQLNPLKRYFKKIIVIAPVFFSGGLLPNDRYCKNYSYDTISVYYPRCLFLPRSVSIPLVKNSDKLLFDTRLSAVKNLIKREHIRFDLIHAHFTWPSAFIAARLKEQYRVPVVATIHEDSGWLDEELAMNAEPIQCAWQNADALIRVNKKEIPLLQKMIPEYFLYRMDFPGSTNLLINRNAGPGCRYLKKKKLFSVWVILLRAKVFPI